ncbi:MAG TPA: RebB family R body protein [Rhodocyclaceae bacterium]|nr:RebB family R body protein [Rhodocyclaceae bacterium]
MAFPTALNDQITDAVSQSGVQVLGDAPPMAMGALYQAAAHSLGILFENTVQQQQNASILANAVVTGCVKQLTKS